MPKFFSRTGEKVNLNLYRITSNDKPFLTKLLNDLDVRKLHDGFNEKDYTQWNEIIQSAIAGCISSKNGLLVAKDNTPCGILCYSDMYKNRHVRDVATWPADKNQKVPFAAKTLFLQLFKETLDSSIFGISLNAIKGSEFTPINKYISLGFSPLGGEYPNLEFMKILKPKLASSIDKLQEFINLTPAKSTEEVCLNEILQLKI